MIDVRFRPPMPTARRDDVTASDFERVGGEVGLRILIDDFMDRVFVDPMIGYVFDKAPKPRIRNFEYRYAAAHLGGGVVYDGRSLAEAHAKVTIFDGHFARRLWVLKETLEAHDVPGDIVARWLAHNEAQRDAVMTGSCR